ncbi:MAG: hypothetical protein ABIJ46_04265 [bacterium]
MAKTSFLKDLLGWGFVLWLVGYILGFVFFALVPLTALGWVIMPFGVAVTLWVLLRKVRRGPFGRYVWIGLTWTVLAAALDYLFIVLLLRPEDNYYKPDVYIYYALTMVLPPLVGWWRGFYSVRSLSDEFKEG